MSGGLIISVFCFTCNHRKSESKKELIEIY